MTTTIQFFWPPHRLLPYEKRLAGLEVKAAFGKAPSPSPDGLTVTTGKALNGEVPRLTYFSHVLANGRTVETLQSQLERSAFSRVGAVPIRRQSTRYSAHGLHEYRGKFNPQIVRSIGNLLKLRPGSLVLDPFCGSGTTLVEAAHASWGAYGVDLNPLAVLISNAKLATLHCSPNLLQRELLGLAATLEPYCATLTFDRRFTTTTLRRLRGGGGMPGRRGEYLAAWFPESVLAQMAFAENAIQHVSKGLRDVARVVLSDCLRACSWQDPGDLRIRRRKDPKENYPLLPLFVRALSARIGGILRAREVLSRVQGNQHACIGDSRRGVPANQVSSTNGYDALITSPPYATALPYIDTQRLSLVYLGLLEPSELPSAERALIGGREITRSERDDAEATLTTGSPDLPPAIVKLCSTILGLTQRADCGFRRRNTPALLRRYFLGMSQSFLALRRIVQRGVPYALVVGPNRTVIGGSEILIDTPGLLMDVADDCGWTVVERIPLDAYARFDVHQKNSITRESLILLRAR